jgi:hypothetical protein
MNEQFFAAIIGNNESETFFAVKPLYFTCTHCNSFGPYGPQTKILPLNFSNSRILLRDVGVSFLNVALYQKPTQSKQEK